MGSMVSRGALELVLWGASGWGSGLLVQAEDEAVGVRYDVGDIAGKGPCGLWCEAVGGLICGLGLRWRAGLDSGIRHREELMKLD